MFNKLIKIAVVECLNRTRQTFEASCIQNRLPFSFDTLRLSEIERKNKKLEMFSQTQSRTKGTTAKRSSRIPPLPQKTTATDLEPSSKTSLFLGIIITTTNSCESTNTQSCLPACLLLLLLRRRRQSKKPQFLPSFLSPLRVFLSHCQARQRTWPACNSAGYSARGPTLDANTLAAYVTQPRKRTKAHYSLQTWHLSRCKTQVYEMHRSPSCNIRSFSCIMLMRYARNSHTFSNTNRTSFCRR